MQHRMMKDAERAMAPWMGGQQVYGPMSHASQMNPLLYSGTYTSCYTAVNEHMVALTSLDRRWVFIHKMFPNT